MSQLEKGPATKSDEFLEKFQGGGGGLFSIGCFLGKGRATKSDEFSEKFPGGSFSIQKFILQILGTLNRAF